MSNGIQNTFGGLIARYHTYTPSQQTKLIEFSVGTFIAIMFIVIASPLSIIVPVIAACLGCAIFLIAYLLHQFDERREQDQRTASEIASLKGLHESEMREINERHSATVDKLAANHDREIERIQADYQGQIRTLLSSAGAKSEADMHYIGGIPEGTRWFTSNASGAVDVWNMVYRSRQLLTRSYRNEYDQALKKVRELLESTTCMWHDFQIQCGDTMPLDEFYSSLSKTMRQGYEAKSLDLGLTLIQVTIIKYDDGRSAVCVGYDYDGCREPRVFVSWHPDNVRFYEDWLRRLYDDPRAKLLYSRTDEDRPASPNPSDALH